MRGRAAPGEMGPHRGTSEPGSLAAARKEGAAGEGVGVTTAVGVEAGPRRAQRAFLDQKFLSSALWPKGGAEGPDRRPPWTTDESLVPDGPLRARRVSLDQPGSFVTDGPQGRPACHPKAKERSD